MTDYDPYLHRLEADSAAKSEAVRQMIIEAGRPDVLAQYDEAMRLNRLGITGARATWHSISPAQRAALFGAAHWGGRVAKRKDSPRCYGFAVNGGVTGTLYPIRISTIRNLCERELMAWDGGAFDPEAEAVVTERGCFVLAHGPMPNGERFTG